MALLLAMGDTLAQLMLALSGNCDQHSRAEKIVTTHDAYMEAIERVLGVAPISLYRAEIDQVMEWMDALNAASVT